MHKVRELEMENQGFQCLKKKKRERKEVQTVVLHTHVKKDLIFCTQSCPLYWWKRVAVAAFWMLI